MPPRTLSTFMGRTFRGRALDWIAAAALLLGCRSEAAPTTTVYAVTKGGLLYRSSDGAATWQQVPLVGVPAGSTYTTWLAVDPVGNISLTLAQNAVGKMPPAGGLLRALYRSVDGGQTWSHTDLPSTVSIRLAVDPTAPNIIYGSTGQGFVRSTDSGATFGPFTLNQSVSGIGSDPQQPGVVYATAESAQRLGLAIYKSTDYWSDVDVTGDSGG